MSAKDRVHLACEFLIGGDRRKPEKKENADMLRIGKVFVCLLALASFAAGQSQTSVKVNDKEYTVTEFQGRSSHMVQFSGPEGSAMVTVSKDKITAYINPPGGGAFKDLIDQVWTAYQAQKSGQAGGQQASAADDPHAALRAKVDAMTAQAQERATGSATGSKEIAIDHLTDDGAVINSPKLGAVTVSDNGMKFTWTVAPNGAKPARYTAEFEGGEKEAGAGKKALKFIKSGGTALADSMNTHANAASSITSNTDVWRIREVEGKIKTLVYESGGMRTGGYIAATGRDPIGRRGEDTLFEISKVYAMAKQAIDMAKKNGTQIAFDSATDRARRGEAALQKAVQDYK